MAKDADEMLRKVVESLKEGNSELDEMPKKVKGVGEKTKELKAEFDNVVGSVKNIGGALNGALNMFGTFNLSLDAVVGKMLEVNQQFTDLSKATGGMSDLQSQISAVSKASAGLGLRMQDIYKTVQAANEAIFGFNELSTKQQMAIGGTINRLEKLGVQSGVSTQTINMLNKSLGMTAEQSSKTAMDMAAFARELGSGMTPAKVAQQFNDALPKLAAYGKGAVNEFKKLAAQAKHTGMEVNELLGIAEKFDTFESAAESTAQLNAMLGTQINSVDMLTATEGERLEMLKESFDATGRSFDQLDRFEQKALAQASGFQDVGKAAAFFNSSLDDIAETEEAMAKEQTAIEKQNDLNGAIARGTSIQEGFNSKVEQLQVIIGKRVFPIINRFIKFLLGPAEKTGKAPIDLAMDMFDEFMTFMENEVIKPFTEFMETAEGQKFINDFLIPFLGAVLSITPIMTGLAGVLLPVVTVIGTVTAAFGAVVKVLGFLGFTIPAFAAGTLLPFIGALALVGVAVYSLYAVIKDNWDLISLTFEEYIDRIVAFLPSIKQFFVELANDTVNFFSKIVEGGLKFFNGLPAEIRKPMDEVFDVVFGVGEKIFDFLANVFDPTQFFASFFGNIPDFLDEYLPEDILLMKQYGQETAGQYGKPQLKKLHAGGDMVGPAIIRNDEYVMIPPKNTPPGEVMTPQQMSRASNSSDLVSGKLAKQIAEMNQKNPVTVVINVDGREFVRETVIPALNKEFNLQGFV